MDSSVLNIFRKGICWDTLVGALPWRHNTLTGAKQKHRNSIGIGFQPGHQAWTSSTNEVKSVNSHTYPRHKYQSQPTVTHLLVHKLGHIIVQTSTNLWLLPRVYFVTCACKIVKNTIQTVLKYSYKTPVFFFCVAYLPLILIIFCDKIIHHFKGIKMARMAEEKKSEKS